MEALPLEEDLHPVGEDFQWIILSSLRLNEVPLEFREEWFAMSLAELISLLLPTSMDHPEEDSEDDLDLELVEVEVLSEEEPLLSLIIYGLLGILVITRALLSRISATLFASWCLLVHLFALHLHCHHSISCSKPIHGTERQANLCGIGFAEVSVLLAWQVS